MFLGDHWIGMEPFMDEFKEIGLDAVVGSVGNGATLRLISDIEGVRYTEGRFLPYFFPDTFHEGGDPVKEAKINWVTARRAILRKPIDRIGYGGYLKLALKFPEFIDYVESVCDEFRTLYENIKGTKAYCVKTVAVLNSWGKMRAWGIKEYDGDKRTVLAVQIENEMGYANTDMDYSEYVLAEYQKEVPECLTGVRLEDSGVEDLREGEMSPWKRKFGRHSHEAFSAWHHARYIDSIAQAGKQIYDLPMLTNVMIGETGYEEPGRCYNSGAAVGRVLDIWKAGAPHLDLIGPDIYNQNRREYVRICGRYDRRDNPLFIPESPPGGEANAMNALLAVADYGAVGICCFGAEHALDENGNLLEQYHDMAVTMRTIAGMIPLLVCYRKTGKIHAVAEEEFETSRYIRLEEYHVVAHFMHTETMRLGYTQEPLDEMGKDKTQIRGRALLIQTGAHEFFVGGAGVAFDPSRGYHSWLSNAPPTCSKIKNSGHLLLHSGACFLLTGHMVAGVCTSVRVREV